MKQSIRSNAGRTLAALALLSLAALGQPQARAADWPQWMGPNRDGISPDSGLLQSWPVGGPKLLWKATGLGDGYSGLALVGDRIFTTGDREDANFVIALNRADGKPVWTTKLGRAGAPGWGNFAGPRMTPTVDGGLLYAVGQYGDVVCLETATGREVWRKHYLEDFAGELPEWGFTSAPLVDGNRVILAPGGKQGNLVALDKKTGALSWRSENLADNLHYSSAIAEVIGGVRQYIQLTEAHVAGVAAADGRLLWQAPRRGRTAVIPTPIYADPHVYVTSGYGVGCNLFEITADNGKFAAREVYDNKVMVNHHGGVIKLGDFVYGYSDGKGWTCQNFKTGEAVWQDKSLGKGAIAYADNRFYLRQEDGKGTVALIEATPEGYREHGRFDQPDRTKLKSWTHPVIIDGKLYLRDQDLLLCYSVK